MTIKYNFDIIKLEIPKIGVFNKGDSMKKLIKVVLCLILVAMLSFAPKLTQGPGDGGPGPDDRPISYINGIPGSTEGM